MAPKQEKFPLTEALQNVGDQITVSAGNVTNYGNGPRQVAQGTAGPITKVATAATGAAGLVATLLQVAAVAAEQRLKSKNIEYDPTLFDVNVPDALATTPLNPMQPASFAINAVGSILQEIDQENRMNLTLKRSQLERGTGEFITDTATGAGAYSAVKGATTGLGKFAAKRLGGIAAGALPGAMHEAAEPDATPASVGRSAAVAGAFTGALETAGSLVARAFKKARGPKLPPTTGVVAPTEQVPLRVEGPKLQQPQRLALPAPEPDDFYRGTTFFLEDLQKTYPKRDRRISPEAVSQLMRRHPAMVNVERDVINEVLEKAKAYGKVTPNSVINAVEAIFPRLVRVPQKHSTYSAHKEYFDKFFKPYDMEYGKAYTEDLGIIDISYQSPDAKQPSTHINKSARPEFPNNFGHVVQHKVPGGRIIVEVQANIRENDSTLGSFSNAWVDEQYARYRAGDFIDAADDPELFWDYLREHAADKDYVNIVGLRDFVNFFKERLQNRGTNLIKWHPDQVHSDLQQLRANQAELADAVAKYKPRNPNVREQAANDLSTNDYYKPMLSAELVDAYNAGDKFILLASPETAALVQGHSEPMMQYAAMARWLSKFAPVEKGYIDPQTGLTFAKVDLTAPPKQIVKNMQAFFGSMAALGVGGAAFLLGEKNAEAGILDGKTVVAALKAIRSGAKRHTISSRQLEGGVDALLENLSQILSPEELHLIDIDGIQASRWIESKTALTPERKGELITNIGPDKQTRFGRPVKELSDAELMQISHEEVNKKAVAEVRDFTNQEGTADLRKSAVEVSKALRAKIGHLQKNYGDNLTLDDVSKVTGVPVAQLRGDESGVGGMGGAKFRELLAPHKATLEQMNRTKGVISTTVQQMAMRPKPGAVGSNPAVDAVLQQAGTSPSELADLLHVRAEHISGFDPTILAKALEPGGSLNQQLRMVRSKYKRIAAILNNPRPDDPKWVAFSERYSRMKPAEAVEAWSKDYKTHGIKTESYDATYSNELGALDEAKSADEIEAIELAFEEDRPQDFAGYSSRSVALDPDDLPPLIVDGKAMPIDAAEDYNVILEHIGTGRQAHAQMGGMQIAGLDQTGAVKFVKVQPVSAMSTEERFAAEKSWKDLRHAVSAQGGAGTQAAWKSFLATVRPALRKMGLEIQAGTDKYAPSGFRKFILWTDLLTRKIRKYPQLAPVAQSILERYDYVKRAEVIARQLMGFGENFKTFQAKYPREAEQYLELLKVWNIQREVDPIEKTNRLAQIIQTLGPDGQQQFIEVHTQIEGMRIALREEGEKAIKEAAKYDSLQNANAKMAIDNFIRGKLHFNQEYVTMDRSGRYFVEVMERGTAIHKEGFDSLADATKFVQNFEQRFPNASEATMTDRINYHGQRKVRGQRMQRYETAPGTSVAKHDIFMDALGNSVPESTDVDWSDELMKTVENLAQNQLPVQDPRLNTRDLTPGYKVTYETIYKNFVDQYTAFADLYARAKLKNDSNKLTQAVSLATPNHTPRLAMDLIEDSRDMLKEAFKSRREDSGEIGGWLRNLMAIRFFGLSAKFVMMQLLQEPAMIGQMASKFGPRGLEAFGKASIDVRNWGLWLKTIEPGAGDIRAYLKAIQGSKNLSLEEKQVIAKLAQSQQLSPQLVDALIAKNSKLAQIGDKMMFAARRAELHNRLLAAMTFTKLGIKMGYAQGDALYNFVVTHMNMAAPSNDKLWLPRFVNAGGPKMRGLWKTLLTFQRFNAEQANLLIEAFGEPFKNVLTRVATGTNRGATRMGKSSLQAAYAPAMMGTLIASEAMFNPLTYAALLGGTVFGTGYLGSAAGKAIGAGLGAGQEPRSINDILKAVEKYPESDIFAFDYPNEFRAALQQYAGIDNSSGASKGLLYDTAIYGLLSPTGFTIRPSLEIGGLLGNINVGDVLQRTYQTIETEVKRLKANPARGAMDLVASILGPVASPAANAKRITELGHGYYRQMGENVGVENLPMGKALIGALLQVEPVALQKAKDTAAQARLIGRVRSRLRELITDNYKSRRKHGEFRSFLEDEALYIFKKWNDAVDHKLARRYPDLARDYRFNDDAIKAIKKQFDEIDLSFEIDRSNSPEGKAKLATTQGKKIPTRVKAELYYKTRFPDLFTSTPDAETKAALRKKRN